MRISTSCSVALAFFWSGVTPGGASESENVLAERMYASERAREVGDLVTVIVNESTASSKKEALSTSKGANASAAAGEFGDFSVESEDDESNFGHLNRKLRFKTPPYAIAANTKFNGDGSASSEETLSTRFTSRIVDVLPNGVYVIRGERVVTMSGEQITMVLTGLARSQDITAENTINSTRLADAHIHYLSTGNVSRGTRPGWLWRALQFINPF